jgi:serine/threonine protein kinase/Tfp pilus assembly protein PilF
VARLVERFEADWRSSEGQRPEPLDYALVHPEECPVALPALLRADLALRWGGPEQRPVEWYLDRSPDLDPDALLALLYEEYCLREERGESPSIAEYERRFPETAGSFREVLEIHDLVGRAELPWSPNTRGLPDPLLPEAGQTIAGFRLVEELGRGTFGRVYLAEERHLADRSVALKVTRRGSREPQTLARLQHTHIMPVFSHQVDPATGLHLLCMPYLGRITLARVLADPAIRTARTGADLVNLLDRLRPSGTALPPSGGARSLLARKSFSRAIAWWGARMADALYHAHERGVLHRDVKPSNVLIAGDGLPLLLDFNLAQEPRRAGADKELAAFGGTLAYMAPEHLEAMATGAADAVDARSDVYALGLLLFDCLIRGMRTFTLPAGSSSMSEALLSAARRRRDATVRLQSIRDDVPPALEAVVQRCLAADPSGRYASAGELAADLQAVADDAPLRFAREPLGSRSLGWLRRNRRRLAVAIPILMAFALTGYTLVGARIARLQRVAEVQQSLSSARLAAVGGRLDESLNHYDTAERLSSADAGLRALHETAVAERRRAKQMIGVRDRADELFSSSERLRSLLLGFGGATSDAFAETKRALATFALPDDPRWMAASHVELLDGPRRDRLLGEVNDLLFLWVVALERGHPGDPVAARQVIRLCDTAEGFADPLRPWAALRRRRDPASPGSSIRPSPGDEPSPRGCFQWGILSDLDGRGEDTIAWLERATSLDPGDFWAHFYLGYYLVRAGRPERALEEFHAAVALRPDSPWARYNRSLLHHARGDWDQALEDLDHALSSAGTWELPEARLELGVVKQLLGDPAGARAAYDEVIAKAAGGPLARAGRLNRAKLDIDAGATARAWGEYDALLAEDPRDASARLGRALLALRLGRAESAEIDLSILLREAPENADELLARRALARLALGRLEAAEADAAGAFRRVPNASRRRLWARTLVALARVEELAWLDRPDDLADMPDIGGTLRSDLRRAVDRLGTALGRGGPPHLRLTLAVFLSALGDLRAEEEASRAVAMAPGSADAYLVRARVRRRARKQRAALDDLRAGLACAPSDARLLEELALVECESGHPGAGLADLDRAAVAGADSQIHQRRAQAMMALGRLEAALQECSLAIEADAEDPRGYLGRAEASIRLRLHDRAAADLEQAADWAAGNPAILGRTCFLYARVLGARPDRLPRFLRLARSALLAGIRSLPAKG